jgi:hypothetical protein
MHYESIKSQSERKLHKNIWTLTEAMDQHNWSLTGAFKVFNFSAEVINAGIFLSFWRNIVSLNIYTIGECLLWIFDRLQYVQLKFVVV